MWDYDVVRQGYRAHLGAVPAAIGLSQLQLIDTFIANRQHYCQAYDDRLAHVEGVRLLGVDWSQISPYIYVIRVRDAQTRSELMAHLLARGISSGIHFLGAHHFSFYQGCRAVSLEVTERVSDQVLTLPLHSFMDAEVIDRVCAAVRSFFC